MEQTKIKQGEHTVEQKRLFPHETIFNSMTIPPKRFKLEWRPNNYRRQIKVKIKSDSTLNVLSNYFGDKCNVGKRNKLFFTKHFVDGVTLQYGRDTLVAMFPQRYVDGEKEVYVIEDESFEVCEAWVLNKREEIKCLLDEALFSFIRKFGIVVFGAKPIWSRHEDWTISDEIRKLDPWEIIHGSNIKKVYPKGIELTGGKDKEPAISMLNRFHNESLRRFTPEIAEAIWLVQPLRYLKKHIRSVDDVLRLKETIKLLTVLERAELSTWIIINIGGG